MRLAHARAIGMAGLIAMIAVTPVSLLAADDGCALAVKSRRAVVKIVDGDTLLLDDKSEASLLGALAPAPPTGEVDWTGWPPALAARKALEALAPPGTSIDVAFEDRQTDRHGRLLAQLFIGEGPSRTWLQGALVAAGHARAYSLPRGSACAGALLARETAARQARRGLWANAAYAVREAWRTKDLLRAVQSYQIIEGEVAEVADRRRTVYINFGHVWREDFTVLVERRSRPLFDKAGIDLLKLKGLRVRVRGWIEDSGGPMIKATHPAQIEVLDDAPTSDPADARP